MKRTECGGCAHDNLAQILDLGETPLADEFPASTEEAEAQRRYPLKLLACEACRLVQLEEVVPDAELFGSSYGFYSGTSSAILDYYDQYAQWIHEHFDSNSQILEIACNDGGLLESLRKLGFNRTEGIDPASGPARVAQENGFTVHNEAFTDTWKRPHDYDLVIANHVVAHVNDLGAFLRGVRACLSARGKAVIEFQYLPDLLVGNMIDHVYHEHRFFFSLSSFNRAAVVNGLYMERANWINRQGGSMRVTLSRERPQYAISEFGNEKWLSLWEPYDSLQGRANHIKSRLLDLINPARGLLAGYGAPAKATTLLNFCGLSKRDLSWVVDTTPTKMGKFMPGTNIPIVGPSTEPQTPHQYLLLVWNYLPEILRKESSFIDEGGQFIVPIPYPTVI